MYLWKEANGPPAAASCLYVSHSDKNRAQSATSVYFTDINMNQWRCKPDSFSSPHLFLIHRFGRSVVIV